MAKRNGTSSNATTGGSEAGAQAAPHAQTPNLSFSDSHGGTVSLPPGEAAAYAGVKTELAGALSRLLLDVADGEIDLDKRDADIFRWNLNAVLNDIRELIHLVELDRPNSMKGSA